MKKYAIYDKVTGEIIKHGHCSHRDFGTGQGLSENQDVIEVDNFPKNMEIEYEIDVAEREVKKKKSAAENN